MNQILRLRSDIVILNSGFFQLKRVQKTFGRIQVQRIFSWPKASPKRIDRMLGFIKYQTGYAWLRQINEQFSVNTQSG